MAIRLPGGPPRLPRSRGTGVGDAVQGGLVRDGLGDLPQGGLHLHPHALLAGVAAREHELAHHVAELADVARPVVVGEIGHQGGRHPGVLGGEEAVRFLQPVQLLAEEVEQQQAEVLAPAAQRRGLDLVSAQPVQERCAEPAGGRRVLQVGVGGGDPADVDLPGSTAHRLDLAGLEGA